MKAKLEFNLPEEKEEFDSAVNGIKYKLALDDIWNQCFRPLYKHGYGKLRIDEANSSVHDAIDAIADIYNEIMQDLHDDITN